MSKISPNASVTRAPRKRVFGKGESALRAALYARVSTHDQQMLPMQLAAMRDYARKRGWEIAVELQDVGSGALVGQKREKLLTLAKKRGIDLVVVWQLDRWGRSLVDLVNTLQGLSSLKVGFVSLNEALDMTTPSGRALAGILAVFCGIRTRHSAGPRQGRHCPSPQGWKAPRSAAFCGSSPSEDQGSLQHRIIKAGGRQANRDQQGFGASALGHLISGASPNIKLRMKISHE